MILYKYMSLAGAIKAIETSSIGFTHLEDFNDPFEGTSYGFKENSKSVLTPAIAKNACFNRFSRNYGVLSLTRQPLNSLMWSHYGDSHKGVIIGIDVNKANFNSSSENFIPYQVGEVIYTSTKPNNDLNIINEEELLTREEFDSLINSWYNQNIEIYNCDCELNSWNLKKKIKSF